MTAPLPPPQPGPPPLPAGPPPPGYGVPPGQTAQPGYAVPPGQTAQPGYGVPPGYPPPGYPPPGYPPPGYPPPWVPVMVAPNGRPLADFSERLLAWLIDGVILGFFTIIVTGPVMIVPIIYWIRLVDRIDSEPVEPGQTPPEVLSFFVVFYGLFAIVLLLSLLFAYVYTVEMMFRSGQTIGKRFMKIKIVPLDPAHALTRQIAFKRYLLQHPAALVVPGLNWLDGLWQLWDKPFRQCLHDKFAMTTVIKVDA